MATLLQAQPFIDQINANGEDADIYLATNVGYENPATGYIAASKATGQDENNWVWLKVSTTVLVIRTNTERDFGARGFYAKGSLACRVDANIFLDDDGNVLSALARIVLKDGNRAKGASVPVNRTASTATDTLIHPFITSIGHVQAIDMVYAAADYSLVANSDANSPFAPDSILWLGGTKPTDNHSYGVSYRYSPLSNLLYDTGNLSLTGADGIAVPITCVFDRVPVGG